MQTGRGMFCQLGVDMHKHAHTNDSVRRRMLAFVGPAISPHRNSPKVRRKAT